MSHRCSSGVCVAFETLRGRFNGGSGAQTSMTRVQTCSEVINKLQLSLICVHVTEALTTSKLVMVLVSVSGVLARIEVRVLRALGSHKHGF